MYASARDAGAVPAWREEQSRTTPTADADLIAPPPALTAVSRNRRGAPVTASHRRSGTLGRPQNPLRALAALGAGLTGMFGPHRQPCASPLPILAVAVSTDDTPPTLATLATARHLSDRCRAGGRRGLWPQMHEVAAPLPETHPRAPSPVPDFGGRLPTVSCGATDARSGCPPPRTKAMTARPPADAVPRSKSKKWLKSARTAELTICTLRQVRCARCAHRARCARRPSPQHRPGFGPATCWWCPPTMAAAMTTDGLRGIATPVDDVADHAA